MTTTRPRGATATLTAALVLILSSVLLGAPSTASAAGTSISGYVDLGSVGVRADEGEVRVTLRPYTALEDTTETLTDEQGAYRFDDLGSGAYTLTFTYLGDGAYATRSTAIIAMPGTVDYMVPVGVRLSGRLEFEGGVPAPNVLVEIGTSSLTDGLQTTTDDEGAYDFGFVPLGARTLSFTVPRWSGTERLYYQGPDATAAPTPTALSTIATTTDSVIDATVSSGPGITGIVRDTIGAPIPGIHATLYDGGTVVATTTTDETGRYWFRTLRATGDEYHVRFSSDEQEDGYPAYTEIGWPDSAWWDPNWVGISAVPIDLDHGFDVVLHAYTQIAAHITGPGAVNGTYGALLMDLQRWDEAQQEWEFGGMSSDIGELNRDFTNLLPGYYLLTVRRNANGAFAPIQAMGYVEEGNLASFSLWLKNPMSAQLLTFADVPPTHQFSAEIEWLFRAGITRGTVEADGTRNYYPAQSVSRAAMAAFLYRAAGEPDFVAPTTPSFADVPADFPFYTEIEWMKSVGITTGTHLGAALLYQPDADVIRRDMAAFLYRASGEPTFSTPTAAPFTDTPLGSQFVREIAWLKSEHISRGNPDGSYGPADPIHRAAMAAFLSRMDSV